MAVVLIHRCTLRVVRRGGWNWGPEPRRVVEEVVHLLPLLLARQLERLLPEPEEDLQIAAPVRLRLSLPASTLRGATSESMPAPAAAAASADQVLEAKMEVAIRQSLRRYMEFAEPDVVSPSPKLIDKNDADQQPNPLARQAYGSALQRVLLSWYEQGSLKRRIESLPLEVIEAWHRALHFSGQDSGPAPGEHLPDEALGAAIREHAAEILKTDRRGLLLLRITLAVQLAAQRRVGLDNPALWLALDRALPPQYSGGEPQGQGDASVALPTARPVQPELTGDAPSLKVSSSVPLLPPSVAGVQERWETHVACALPFLLLGPLAKLGYLETLAAVLETAKLADYASLFAQALAYKVLAAPYRGWRRSPDSMAAAAAFAGLRVPAEEGSLVTFARRVAAHLAPLDLLISDALAAGHNPERPVVVCSAQAHGLPEFQVAEPEGCFPIAWVADVEAMLRILHSLGRPIVLVAPELATLALLKQLDSSDIPFITTGPPARGESWQRVQQGHLQLGWSNSAPSPRIVNAAREFEAACERAADFTAELAVKRPGVVRAATPELERTLTLAASTAAGIISWELWRERGPTSPQLALERFSDLDARVRFTREAVHIELALGRRRQELLDGGLLRSVGGIPWLRGKRVEYGGG